MLGRTLCRYMMAYTPRIQFIGKRSGQQHNHPTPSSGQPAQQHSTSKLDISKLQAFGRPLQSPTLTDKQIAIINEGGYFQMDYKKVKPVPLKK